MKLTELALIVNHKDIPQQQRTKKKKKTYVGSISAIWITESSFGISRISAEKSL